MPAPIVLFCFNRPDHLRQTIDGLRTNSLATASELYVICDGPRHNRPEDLPKIEQVRSIVTGINGFSRVHTFYSAENMGLAKAIITHLSRLFASHKALIVLEDDIIVHPLFLDFMNQALEKYKENMSISSVSGYSYGLNLLGLENVEFALVKRASSWGWGTWSNRWTQVDWEVRGFNEFISDRSKVLQFADAGKDQVPMLVKQQKGLIQSWAVRWTYHHYKTNTYCLIPVKSLLNNIGTDGTGTNFNIKTKKYDVEIADYQKIELPSKISPDPVVQRFIRNHFNPSFFRRIINFIKFGVWL
ncbi:glycosyltransferase [Jiulongibacter sediminis]|uniref:glycosyltransferase n=1 Tax=Jiulongibacter sediminis TaxID=1605367 RepID=UPI0012FDB4F7|nr:glycosyltransferase [Jiulongibacter sediminis]